MEYVTCKHTKSSIGLLFPGSRSCASASLPIDLPALISWHGSAGVGQSGMGEDSPEAAASC
jgi:hypothetical protein